jgi:hypothetical protein
MEQEREVVTGDVVERIEVEARAVLLDRFVEPILVLQDDGEVVEERRCALSFR